MTRIDKKNNCELSCLLQSWYYKIKQSKKNKNLEVEQNKNENKSNFLPINQRI